MRVLIVEDEARLARNIASVLREKAAFAVDIAYDGQDGLHQAQSGSYDLLILDLMLPKLGGLDILREIRRKGLRVPVLVLTARAGTDNIVEALDIGSDDYLTKPFELAELLARCRSLIRRSYDHPDPIVRLGDIEINTHSHVVAHRGRRIVLPAMEYRLLEFLAMRTGQVVSKTDILEHLYDFDAERFSNVIEVYICSLRKHFGSEIIRTLRGQGYVLEGAKP
ncbi:MAG: response regulator transcription factor [Planctomycetaceae bacterium]|nr:response regulator transcription factor [Planctomycetaceae bacterium]